MTAVKYLRRLVNFQMNGSDLPTISVRCRVIVLHQNAGYIQPDTEHVTQCHLLGATRFFAYQV